MLKFEDPIFLLLLFLVPVMFWWRKRYQRLPSILFSDLRQLTHLEDRGAHILTHIVSYLRYIVLILLIIAMARPQLATSKVNNITEGVDIAVVLDMSPSMAAEDFDPNRFEVSKGVIKSFISKRNHDRLALIVFGRDAYTQFPLTTDYAVLNEFVDRLEIGGAGDGTAIGTSIVTALSRLRDSDARSKLIVLLTDGENNAGEVTPEAAARLAQEMGIKIYTVGVGKEGIVKVPYQDPLFGKRYANIKTSLNEKSLTQIATITGGQFYRAQDRDRLEEIYDEIDQLETTTLSSTTYYRYKELFPSLLKWALIFLFLEVVLGSTVLMRIP